MAQGIKISQLPEHFDNVTPQDWMPFVDSSSGSTKKISPENLFDQISALKQSNWVKVKTVNFNNEPIGNFSVDVPSFSSGTKKYLIVCSFGSATDSGLRFSLRLNNVSSSSYGRRFIQYQTNIETNGSGDTVDRIQLMGTAKSDALSITEVVIDKNANKTLANTHTHYHSEGEYQGIINFGHKYDSASINTLDFFDHITSSSVNGTVEIYEWKDMNVVDLASYELVKEVKLNNETFSFDVPVEDGDEIKFETSFNTVSVRINNDSGSSYERNQILIDTATTNDIRGSITNVSNIFGKSGTIHLNTGNCWADTIYDYNTAQYGMAHHLITWNNTTDTPHTLTFLRTDTNITGTIKVYKLTKSHVIRSGYGLWKKFTFNNEPVNIDIDTSEYNGEELMINTIGDLANTGSITMTYNNNGSTNFMAEDTYIRDGAVQTATLNPYNGMIALDTKCFSKTNICIQNSSSTTTMVYKGSSFSTPYKRDIGAWYSDFPKVTSLQFNSVENFTGTISIYRLG